MSRRLQKDPDGPLSLPKLPNLPSLPKLPKLLSLPKLSSISKHTLTNVNISGSVE
jgi:hypothetical protein